MTALNLNRSDAGDGCLSDLALDQLLTGESAGSLAEQTRRRHLAQCPACAARLAELEREAAMFLADRPRLAPASDGASGRRARWIAGAVAAVAAVAAIALFRPPAPPSDIRVKGSAIEIEVYAKSTHGRVAPLFPGQVAHPGDLLRFRLTAHWAGYAGVVSVDGARQASDYGSPSGRLTALAPYHAQLLDGAIELDGVLGPERLYAFLCRDRLASAALVRAVQTALDARPSMSPTAADLRLDCALDTFAFTKVAAP